VRCVHDGAASPPSLTKSGFPATLFPANHTKQPSRTKPRPLLDGTLNPLFALWYTTSAVNRRAASCPNSTTRRSLTAALPSHDSRSSFLSINWSCWPGYPQHPPRRAARKRVAFTFHSHPSVCSTNRWATDTVLDRPAAYRLATPAPDV
jgi:hypothetical protein